MQVSRNCQTRISSRSVVLARPSRALSEATSYSYLHVATKHNRYLVPAQPVKDQFFFTTWLPFAIIFAAVSAIIRRRPRINASEFRITTLAEDFRECLDKDPPDVERQRRRYALTMKTMPLAQEDFKVAHLPGRPYPTPLKYPQYHRSLPRVLYRTEEGTETCELSFEHAGPHTVLHFNPPKTTVAIVTCGGLCPGLNDVIRALTLFSLEAYKVKRVIGYQYGFMGLLRNLYTELNADVVRNINQSGGSFLGSSRGYGPDEFACEMVENMHKLGVNVLFTVGGDGTQQGAQALVDEIARQSRDIAVVGIPKTIDNDVAFIQRTFGFSTGVEFAVQCLRAAQIEARSRMNGVCIVKLDGRLSGFVAAQAAVSFGGAHIVLIPENRVDLPTILRLVDANFQWRQYCVVVVAVGFGQSIRPDLGVSFTGEKLGDIGAFLRDAIEEHMATKFKEFTVGYIDPGYLVRSNRANADDAAFCLQLANHAVHEGLNGSTGCVIGSWNDRFTAVPMKLATAVSRQVDLDSELWRAVREWSHCSDWNSSKQRRDYETEA